jgi:endogenous inhibitor of DNA gyrase (YacG/DUF329 family)
VSYLTCPSCGLTLIDRNPLTSPRQCPRCARRARRIDLQRVARVRDRAAALLRREQPEPIQRAE